MNRSPPPRLVLVFLCAPLPLPVPALCSSLQLVFVYACRSRVSLGSRARQRHGIRSRYSESARGLSNLDSNTVFVVARAASRTSNCHGDEFTMLEARPGELYTTTQSKSTPGAPCTS
ncbi:hypothetical protein EXIGLDRAFT_282714 [Exidia glandulosa HHB12029]|uniref:Secreted protein n=1 Tax=Exidia glandulosa HHB12029 TaxID=1314781 RepID=A0A165DIF5_EXIGL|nr:hypothetical protein EXIGLDRAFT_282714 [Exidia glandulosa HHB12029]